jgi:hypothetical protein
VGDWRDEALMLNLASFGAGEHILFIAAGIKGLRDILDLDFPPFQERLNRASVQLHRDAPTELTMQGWWDQARTLEEE